MKHFLAPFLAATCCLFGCATSQRSVEPAEMVVTDAAIYTMESDQPWASALAVHGARIVFVGAEADAAGYVGPNTRVVDLDGAMVMPGLIDAHVHPVRGAEKELYDCNFPFTATPADVQSAVRACVEVAGSRDWIVGGQWDSGFFDRYELESPRRWLDAVSDDKAVVLKDDSLHNVWVNTKALELAGMLDDFPDPDGGRLVRDEQGVPTGILLETAAKHLNGFVPERTLQERIAAVAAWSRIANGFGITAAKAASTYDRESEALKAADHQGLLTVHMAVSLRMPDGVRHEPLNYADVEARRDRYASTRVDTRFVKFFLDGVPTPARTAAMLAPYVHDDDYPPEFSGGELLIPIHPLADDLTELDRRGFTVKMHAAGDRSVRIALDAVAAARATNGESGLIHEIAHAGYVDPDDVPRFSTLGVAPDLSPVLWHPSPIIDAVIAAVGEDRGRRYWPVRDFLDSEAMVVAGSDWPAGVPSANPWVGIEAMVTRRDPSGRNAGALWPEQAVSLEEALLIYTVNGARAVRQRENLGSLSPGKLANFIVLDRNLFQVPIESVGETQVRQTYFEGRLVHDAQQ